MATDNRPRQRIEELHLLATAEAAALGIPAGRTAAALEKRDYFDLIAALLPLQNEDNAERARSLRMSVEELLRIKAFCFPPAVRNGRLESVVFGTGGHRGEIGVGLTLVHIDVIVRALIARIDALRPEELLHHFGADSPAAVRERGMMIGHDNRLLNPEFSFYSAHLLSGEGFRVGYAGRVASPEMSKVVPKNGWAGALNFTPSHNPFRYGGLKFNPADGGLAGDDITEPLALQANRLLEGMTPAAWTPYEELERIVQRQEKEIERVDVHEPYLEALHEHPVIRLGELAQTLKSLPADGRARIVADPVFGGAVPVYRRLRSLFGEEIMTLVNIEDDPYFGGQTTEPNDQTLAQALEELQARPAAHQVAIRNDPDGDRGLVGDAGGAVKMNRFAALVMRYLLDLGFGGDVVTTLPTSRYGVDYAKSRGKKVHLTAVGFKNFRPYLLDNTTMVAYEESDGITITGHTLDKDGVLAGLLALRIVLHYQKPLHELLREIDSEIGAYHYLQINFEVDITAAEVREKLIRLADIKPGDRVDDGNRIIGEVNTEDGYMFRFEDGDWILMRPSGTEPKVRVYAESRRSAADTEALCELGKAMAIKAIQG